MGVRRRRQILRPHREALSHTWCRYAADCADRLRGETRLAKRVVHGMQSSTVRRSASF